MSVPADRRGIAESIEGRMGRNGGVAVIESEPRRARGPVADPREERVITVFIVETTSCS